MALKKDRLFFFRDLAQGCQDGHGRYASASRQEGPGSRPPAAQFGFLVPTRRKSCGTTHVRQYMDSRVSVENFDTIVEIFSTMVSKFGRF